MASAKDKMFHLDEYSCTLCESRAGLSSNCCCPENPQELLQVTEEHFRRRISLKDGQKLCPEHVKKLKSGLLFGRTDWYECCAPFHVKSPQSPKLRSIPHSWKSFFESPSSNKRYHSQQRICWDCYMLAMEVINSGIDDALDEEDEDYQSVSFDLGYTSPKRWASNLSLQQSNSPSGSQAGSTWSLAFQQGALTSRQRRSDASNALNAMRKRARISGGKFMTPSRSFDYPSPRDRLSIPRQASDTVRSIPTTQRNLNDDLSSVSADDSYSLDENEPAAFQSDDFVSIPEFITTPHETHDQCQSVDNAELPDQENSADLQSGKKTESTPDSIGSTKSVNERSASSDSQTEYTQEAGPGGSKSKIEPRLSGSSNPREMQSNSKKLDRDPEDLGSISEQNMTDTLKIKEKQALDTNNHDLDVSASNLSQPTRKSRDVINKMVDFMSSDETEDTPFHNPIIVISENSESSVSDEPVVIPVSKFRNYSSQSRLGDEGISSPHSTTQQIAADEQFDPVQSLRDLGDTSDYDLQRQNEKREINNRPENVEKPVDLLSAGESQNYPKQEKIIEIEEGRFDPIIRRKDSNLVQSDGEGSFDTDVSSDSNFKPCAALKSRDDAAEYREEYDIADENDGISSENDFLGEIGNEYKREVVGAEQHQVMRNKFNSPPQDEDRSEDLTSTAEISPPIPELEASKVEKEAVSEIRFVDQKSKVEQTEVGNLPTEEQKSVKLKVTRTRGRRSGLQHYMSLDKGILGSRESDLGVDTTVQDKVYTGEEKEMAPSNNRNREEQRSSKTTPVVFTQRPTLVPEFSSASGDQSAEVPVERAIVNGFKDAELELEGGEKELQTSDSLPVESHLSVTNDIEVQEIAAQAELNPHSHGPKTETGLYTDDYKSTEQIDANLKPELEVEPDATISPGNSNRADDKERLQFLRRRIAGKRSCSVATPASNGILLRPAESARKSTSSLRPEGLARRRDKKRKSGVTFALNLQQSISIDDISLSGKVLHKGNPLQDEFLLETSKKSDFSIEEERFSDEKEEEESENHPTPTKDVEFGPKEEDPVSLSEDEDVSSVLSNIFQNVFTTKTLSDLIQTLNSGTSVQVLVMTLLSVIAILLILLAIFVFVL